MLRSSFVALCFAGSQTLLLPQALAIETQPAPAASVQAQPMTLPQAESAEPIGAEQQYVKSVAAMRALEIPPFVSYQSAWKSTGLPFRIIPDGGYVAIELSTGGAGVKKAHDYDVAFREPDRRLGFRELPAGDQFSGVGRILNPTWEGAYDILRYGLGGKPPNAGPSPTPEPAAGTEPRTIASVTAIAPSFYRVEDRGAGTCPAGTRGRILKLTAYRDPQAHPLTEVTIDPATDRFCNMRFNLKESGLIGATGNYELHFAPVGIYWLISGGLIDVSVRFFGIAASHTVLTWNNSGVATPADIPASAFIDSAPVPKPSPK